MQSFYFPVRLCELQGVPDVPPVHDAEGHDQGYHAWPWLHGGVSRGGPIARSAQINGLLHRPHEVESSLETVKVKSLFVCRCVEIKVFLSRDLTKSVQKYRCTFSNIRNLSLHTYILNWFSLLFRAVDPYFCIRVYSQPH